MNELIALGAEPTMSSREIAELVESRHDDVKRSVYRLAERRVIALPPLAEVSNPGPGPRKITEFRISKRDSYVIVAQLSPEFTARLVDRWQELEEGAKRPPVPALPNFSDPAAAARAWADQFEARTALERKVVADAPKVEFAETVRNMDAGVTMLQMAKLLGWGRNRFMAQLRAHEILMKNNVPYQKWIDKGYFTVAESTIKRTVGVVPVLSTLVTGAGQVFLQRRYAARAA